MDLTELYQKGKALLDQQPYGKILDAVETEFDIVHDRVILDRYTFRLKCIDAIEASTDCRVLGVDLETPIIMSAVTTPIQAIRKNGLMEMALGLKDAGSLMWIGSQIPNNLTEIVATGVPVAANVRPFKDRKKMFAAIDDIQEAGVRWLGIQVDTGLGTKLLDRMVVTDCEPLSFKDLVQIRKKVSIPLIFKGILSSSDAVKSLDAGADGIVVSHGAHILDYLPHPLQVMDDIVAHVEGKLEIIVDGSFRRGSDVAKGLAFGSCLVGVCRPLLYGLAAAGREGVTDMIRGMTAELRRIMSLTGAPEPGAMTRDILISD